MPAGTRLPAPADRSRADPIGLQRFWPAVSGVFLTDPFVYATPTLLKLLFRGGGPAEVVYAGDRMAPTVRHGERLTIVPVTDDTLRPGRLALCFPDDRPDLLRVIAVDRELVRLGDDVHPGSAVSIPVGQVGAVAEPPRPVPGFLASQWWRLRSDLAEARAAQVASTDAIRSKYDLQAPFYDTADSPGVTDDMVRRIGELAAAGERIVVLGCGTGTECFALARRGYRVTGVDFSRRMLKIAGQLARNRGLDVRFVESDLRFHEQRPGSCAVVFFTGQTYSFLPRRASRIAMLRSMAGWLRPGGALFVSPRVIRRRYDRLMLWLRWLSRRGDPGYEWGDSHTRFLTPNGSLVRTYSHVFLPRDLEREFRLAGLSALRPQGGHFVLVPTESADQCMPCIV